MSIIKKSKMKQMPEAEMDSKLRELRIEISRELATSEIGGSMKNPGKIKEMRKTVARLLTRKRQFGLSKPGKSRKALVD